MRRRGSGNAADGAVDGMAVMSSGGWGCLPLSIVLAGGIAALSMRLRPRPAGWLRMALVALLLPGLLLVFRPELLATGRVHGGATGPVRVLLCRTLGVLPLLVLPLLLALGRMPPGQVRAATGLGAGRAARFRLLWLPQLGPACLAGLLLAGLVDAAAVLHRPHWNAVTLSAPARPS